RYGMKMPKWLTRIEFVNKEYLGYWEWQGWSNTADPGSRRGGRFPRSCAHIRRKLCRHQLRRSGRFTDSRSLRPRITRPA
ncbi:MAG TPA: hypothetical protein VFV14_00960, partial [Myxococcaceae bacterium]|nr:hypothetical protein [Myxococcaceae bacterium]